MRPTAIAARMHPKPARKAMSDAWESPSQSRTLWNSNALRNSRGCIQAGMAAADLVEREVPQTWQSRSPTMSSEPQSVEALSSAGDDWGWAAGGCQNSCVG